MKKLAIILGLLFLGCSAVFADEVVTGANQEVILEANKAVLSIQKQPVGEKSAQKQDVKNNWFCIVIQVNGKVHDTTDNNVK